MMITINDEIHKIIHFQEIMTIFTLTKSTINIAKTKSDHQIYNFGTNSGTKFW